MAMQRPFRALAKSVMFTKSALWEYELSISAASPTSKTPYYFLSGGLLKQSECTPCALRRCNQHVPNAVCSSHIHRPTQCGPHYDFTQHRVRSFARHVQNNPTIHHQIIRTFGFPHVVKALSLQPGSPSSMACITCSTPLPSLILILLPFLLPEGQISSKFGTMWSPLHHNKKRDLQNFHL